LTPIIIILIIFGKIVFLKKIEISCCFYQENRISGEFQPKAISIKKNACEYTGLKKIKISESVLGWHSQSNINYENHKFFLDFHRVN
jgi:hypothetical protein